jgi:hypothetical protein
MPKRRYHFSVASRMRRAYLWAEAEATMKTVRVFAKELTEELGTLIYSDELLSIVVRHRCPVGRVRYYTAKGGRATEDTTFLPTEVEAYWRERYHEHYAQLARAMLEQDRG